MADSPLTVNSIKIPFLGAAFGLPEGAQVFQLASPNNTPITFTGAEKFSFKGDAVTFKKPASIRAVYFDARNLTVDAIVTIRTGQQLRLPFGTQGYIPMYFPFPVDLTITSNTGTGTLVLYLFNFDVDPIIWPTVTGTPFNPPIPQSQVSGLVAALAAITAALATLTPIIPTGNIVEFIDDFIMGAQGILTIGAGGGFSSYDTPWIWVPITGGTTGTLNRKVGSTYNNPGILVFTTTAVTGQGIVLGKFDSNSGLGTLGILGANTGWDFDIWFQTPAVITNYAFRFGLVAGGTANGYQADPPLSGFWCEFDTANANSNANLTLRTNLAGVSSYVSSGVALSANTYYHVRISSSVAGVISMQVGAANAPLGAAVTLNTNVDAVNSAGPSLQVIPRSNTSITATIDRVSFVAQNTRQ